MKKNIWIFFLFLFLMGAIIFAFFHFKDSKDENYVANKLIAKSSDNQSFNMNQNGTLEQPKQVEETEISNYATKLPKDTKARYSNIDLACDTLNGTVIQAGQTFSLWNILGCPTKEKGYQKAKTFTAGGKIKQSYGGGICQVSTTIYNAVLEADGLEIVERHEHSRDVAYVKDGKDAAVSYKAGDFQFKNTLDYAIKLEAKLEDNQVKITLVRI